MDAIAALNEIAFWLERERAAVFKVQAFRKAAAAIGGLDADDLAARTRDGRLKSMKGIGGRTFEVVRQSVDGAVPEYLEALRERGQAPLADGGDEIRKAIRGDLHTHSEWSDGTVPIDVMLAAGHVLGREYMALTDHSPNLTIANGLTVERLTEELDVVETLNASADGARLLSGIEVDILEDGTLDQTPEMLGRLDVVVASVHSKLRSDAKTMTTRMLGGIADPHTDVLGHCTGRLVEGSRGTRPESEFDADAVFAACAAAGVAVEINSRPERQDPPDRLIQVALDAGCLFSIDSDAHAPGQLAFLDYGAARAEKNGVPVDRIVTTWPVERLLEWTGRNR
ncbi:PHP domain-containing protein [Herbiconiux sp. L3-i23]|uniref:PHP domain-containing protein n=1 Tax=Herbiconiux sp. L3-i23 TaxID=2905871 RepID=UPI00205A84C6|nr:PHP domain-containing protein [Herbiconiux sp. L3-i23]BDI22923.1 PHP domain-containing protein [Herbiconiux sp. L3-i23]